MCRSHAARGRPATRTGVPAPAARTDLERANASSWSQKTPRRLMPFPRDVQEAAQETEPRCACAGRADGGGLRATVGQECFSGW